MRNDDYLLGVIDGDCDGVLDEVYHFLSQASDVPGGQGLIESSVGISLCLTAQFE